MQIIVSCFYIDFTQSNIFFGTGLVLTFIFLKCLTHNYSFFNNLSSYDVEIMNTTQMLQDYLHTSLSDEGL